MNSTRLQLILEAVDRATGPLDKVEGKLSKIAKLAAVGVVAGVTATTGAIAGGVNEARKFESAMADVAKVADFEDAAGLKAASQDILEMSRHLPVVADGLATIQAEALQAGVALEDSLDFTRLTAKSAVAFDMTAGAAGGAFAKIRNVMKLDQSGLEDMADAVNYLSNNMAAKAPEIINFLTRAGGAAAMLGLEADEMAAFGSSLIALGVPAETASRGITRMFTEVSVGGERVEGAFDRIGMSHADFMAQLDSNPAAAFQDLFEVLGQSEGGLQSLIDLVGKDFVDDFSKLTENPQLLAQAFGLMADQTDRAGSVLGEYEARAATFDNTIGLFQNNLRAMSIELGNRFLPTLNDGLLGVVNFMQTVGERMTVFDRASTMLSSFIEGLSSGLGLAEATESLQAFSNVFDGIGNFIFGMDLTGLDASTKAMIKSAEAGVLTSIAEMSGSLGAALGDVMSGLTGPLSEGVAALVSSFGAGGAGRELLIFFGSAAFATGGAALGVLADAYKLLASAVGDLISWLTSQAQAIDWSTLVGNLSALAPVEEAVAVIEAIGGALVSVLGAGITSLTTFFRGVFEGFAPYIETLGSKLQSALGAFGPIFDRLASIFNRVGELFGMLEGSETAMSGLQLFGEAVGTVVGVLATLSLDVLGGVLSFIEGLLTIVDRLLAGDITGAFQPIQQFFDWLSSLTIGAMLPGIDAGAVLAEIKSWFAFEWPDVLPDWSVSDLLPSEETLAAARDKLKGVFGSVRDFFSGDDAVPEPLPAANDNVPATVAVPEVPNMARIEAAQADVAKLAADIEGVERAANALPPILTAAMNSVRLAADMDLSPQGRKIMDTLAAGMRARAQAVVDEIRKVTQQVRDHLPSSPARTGPLSDIHRLKFGETIASSIRSAPMVDAMEHAARLTREAANLDIPVPNAPNLVTMRSRVSAADAAASSASGSAGGSAGGIMVHAPLTFQGNVVLKDDADRSRFEDQLRQHADTVRDVVEQATRRKDRVKFR